MTDKQMQWGLLLFVCIGVVGCQSMSIFGNRDMAHRLDDQTVSTVKFNMGKSAELGDQYLVPKRAASKNTRSDLTKPPIL